MYRRLTFIWIVLMMMFSFVCAAVELDGLCVGIHRWHEAPGEEFPEPTEEEVRGDLEFLKNSGLTDTLRFYSTTGGHVYVPRIARSFGFQIYQGAWLDEDTVTNEEEIQRLIQLGQRHQYDVAVVGNEVLLRGDLTQEELVQLIDRVKSEIPDDIPVAYAENFSEWNSGLAGHVDIMLVHIYPFWEGKNTDNAVTWLFNTYENFCTDYPSKRIILGEVGWASAGQIVGDAVPSGKNQKQFFEEFMEEAPKHDAEYFWFSAFDERWKQQNEGAVGEHWGLYYTDRSVKPELNSLIPQPPIPPGADARWLQCRGTLAWGFDLSVADSAAAQDWVHEGGEGLRFEYPEGLCWGAVFMHLHDSRLVNGTPVNPEDQDFSSYSALVFEARSDSYTLEPMRVGCKDRTMRDDGFEPTAVVPYLSSEWNTVMVPLGLLKPLDCSQIEIPVEFVFNGPAARTVHVRNIRAVQHSPGGINITALSPRSPMAQTRFQRVIYMGRALCPPELDMFVDSWPNRYHDWVEDRTGYFELNFPEGEWLSVMGIKSTAEMEGCIPTRGAEDLTTKTILSFDVKTPDSISDVSIGLKTCISPDDGSEPKVAPAPVLNRWRTQMIPLDLFTSQSDDPDFLTHVHLLPEILSTAGIAQTLLVRDIQFTKSLPECSDDLWIYHDQVCPEFVFCTASGSNSTVGYSESEGEITLVYTPTQPDWGMGYFLVGDACHTSEQSINVNRFQSLAFEMKSCSDYNIVSVGIKDINDPDQGNEERVQCHLSDEWTSFSVPLSTFCDEEVYPTNLALINVAFEVVFEGNETQTLKLRNVRYTHEPRVPRGHCTLTEGHCITPGYGIFVDSSEDVTHRVSTGDNYFRLEYPGSENPDAWGAMGFTAGRPSDFPRRGADFSEYTTLILTIRGAQGSENVEVGLKTNTDPDDGLETLVELGPLSTEWHDVHIPLSDFDTANLSRGMERLYTIVEVVFKGTQARTVDIKDIRFVPCGCSPGENIIFLLGGGTIPCDLNNDGTVDIADIVTYFNYFGR